METGISEPSPLAVSSRVHFGVVETRSFEVSSLELGAASTINIQHDHDIQHDIINQHTDDKVHIYDSDTDNNDIIEEIENMGGEDSLGEQSNDQGTPESLREERKNFIYDVATAGPVREMCEEKKPEELVRDTFYVRSSNY